MGEEQKPKWGWPEGEEDMGMGTTCCWWRADVYLTRQEMHLGDSGCIPMQPCKLHSRCTVAEVTCQGHAHAGQARTLRQAVPNTSPPGQPSPDEALS